jgi:orotate phosphoribosyltransferase
MEKNTFRVSLEKNPIISMKVTPGHFSTGAFHLNFYLDVSDLKANALVARDVARELAIPYLSSTLVDTIVCMENTKVIGAFLAEELLQDGTAVMNSGCEIHVVTPMISSIDRKLIFYDNEIEWIENRNIILLTSSISSGQTLNNALECLSYYNGIIKGISALFYSSDAMTEHKIHTLFTSDDIPGYRVLRSEKCGMCMAGEKLDALINSYGYKKI